ncbi:MAG: molybdopterin molybdotransferase MoeA [Acidobacteria bacterium]|jgi:molybdopterin molybdotransferase|nr:molybdopterin molybdotransferase MoeA [Acidobacteriota bacterium]
MLTIDEARSLLAARVEPLDPVEVPLRAALGCRLAAPAVADVDLPFADVSAMDGYAVRAADLEAGTPLPVAFEVPAGAVPERLPEGFAARIFTGAALPAGADTIVQQELAEPRADGRVLLAQCPTGTHVRRRGEVFPAGTTLLPAGAEVTPTTMALLAAGSPGRLTVIRRPRLTIVSTGSELASQGERPRHGQIRDANWPLLDAFARSQGLAPPSCRRVGDSASAVRATLAEALADADVVVSTGGVSVGDHDLVPEAVASLGGAVVFHKVSQKPGKPLLVARFPAGWLVGLPGNPLAVLVGWRLYVLPLVRALSGDAAAFDERPLIAALTTAAANREERTHLRPAQLQGGPEGLRATIKTWEGSHDLVAGAGADALVRLEPGADLTAGSRVVCYPL